MTEGYSDSRKFGSDSDIVVVVEGLALQNYIYIYTYIAIQGC